MKISEFKLERYFAKYEFNSPYLLSSSDCESVSIGDLLSFESQAMNNFNSLKLGYTESLGHPDLRIQISKLYKTVKPENVVVFSGAEEGIFCFMQALLNEGDEIIVQFPSYQSLYEIATSIGVNVIKWEMEESENWDLDVKFLEKNLSKMTKAIVINNPHNPTGNIISKIKYQEIIQFVEEHNLILFSDEVYRFTEFDECDQLEPAVDIYNKALSLGVLSKSFGLPGLRIGWLTIKEDSIFTKISTYKDYTTICNSGPSEYLATLALRYKDIILKRNLDIIKTNMATLDTFFDEYKNFISWVRPKGGSIGFVKINDAKFPSSEKLSEDLIENKGVLLVPGTIFDFDDFHFRIGFGRANLNECLTHLKSYFDNFIVE